MNCWKEIRRKALGGSEQVKISSVSEEYFNNTPQKSIKGVSVESVEHECGRPNSQSVPGIAVIISAYLSS
jgi:hypothetical protein